MQTKTQSFIEACTNTAIGFGVSYASTFLIFPLVGFESSGGKNLIVTLYFTAISILRSYVLRRWFNKNVLPKPEYVKDQNGNRVYYHCFECEIEMPVKYNGDNYYCSNCGLVHITPSIINFETNESMEIETLKKGIAIKQSLDGAETQLAQIRKLYAKKDHLEYDEIEKLFAIASSCNSFVIERLNQDLKKL